MPQTPQDISKLFAYNRWANEKTFGPVAALTDEEYARPLGGSFPSVGGTLAHIYAAEWIWLERWKGVSPPGPPDESELADVVALRDRWKVIEDHRRGWLDALPPSGAAAVIQYRNTAGVPFAAPLWQLVQHVANHSTYHRGQVTTMLRQVGGRTVQTDMVVYDREHAAKT